MKGNGKVKCPPRHFFYPSTSGILISHCQIFDFDYFCILCIFIVLYLLLMYLCIIIVFLSSNKAKGRLQPTCSCDLIFCHSRTQQMWLMVFSVSCRPSQRTIITLPNVITTLASCSKIATWKDQVTCTWGGKKRRILDSLVLTMLAQLVLKTFWNPFWSKTDNGHPKKLQWWIENSARIVRRKKFRHSVPNVSAFCIVPANAKNYIGFTQKPVPPRHFFILRLQAS